MQKQPLTIDRHYAEQPSLLDAVVDRSGLLDRVLEQPVLAQFEPFEIYALNLTSIKTYRPLTVTVLTAGLRLISEQYFSEPMDCEDVIYHRCYFSPFKPAGKVRNVMFLDCVEEPV